MASLALLPKASRCATPYAGCSLTAKQAELLLGSEKVWRSYQSFETGSGDRQFDRALANTLLFLSDRFFVLPGFAFFNEPGSPNAFASGRQAMGRSDGDVLFGRKLFQKIMSSREHPEIAVVAICAHEFGHIAQYKYELYDRLVGPDGRVKRLELHADFLAGYFAGLRRRDRPEFPAAVFASTQFGFGDYLEDVEHHGTPEERGAAVVAGYKAGYEDKQKFGYALETGIRYVSRIGL
ncbi:MAG: metalloprotease [Hyphomicrobiales bacterium]|nr:metalloprotease [Hyphomicrobiales bacterium]